MSAREFLDKLEPPFTTGGKFEKYYGLYEMVDTFIYTPSTVTRGTTHVRDGNDLKRTMTFVVIATAFCILMALFNTGYQANLAINALGREETLPIEEQLSLLLGHRLEQPRQPSAPQ